jgi:hypothetical protein
MTYEELEMVLGKEDAQLVFDYFLDAPVSYLVLEVLDKTPMVELLRIIESLKRDDPEEEMV